MDVVFCGGVHGVGKTRFCQELATLLNAHHVSAGSLFTDAAPTGGAKARFDVEQNQWRIVEELEKTKEIGPIVLDGHFCLINEDAEIYRVPASIFARLAPYALLLLVADAHTIASRLLRRDRTELEVSLIDRLQMAETANAKTVSDTLDTPLRIVRSTDSVLLVAGWLQSLRQ
jgi:adenylate kinase